MPSLSASFPRAFIATPAHHKLFITLLALLTLNLIDAFATLFWVNAGMATEANPLMNQFLLINSTMFLIGKGILAVGGSLLLWNFKYHPLTQKGSALATAIYTLVCFYHLSAFLIFQV